jgi:hypothetical protein
MKRILITCFIVAGCALDATDDDQAEDQAELAQADECNPIGTWETELETTAGDCYDLGITETTKTTVNKSDQADLDRETCSYSRTEPHSSPESDDLYGIDGEITVDIDFRDDRFTGTATLTADLLDQGKRFDTCTQSYSVKGKRL